MDFGQYKEQIIKELNLTDGDDLDIILQIFNLAKLNSRNNEHTKADSYDGLLRVKERILENRSLTLKQRKSLQDEIAMLQTKRDEINTRLQRKVPPSY